MNENVGVTYTADVGGYTQSMNAALALTTAYGAASDNVAGKIASLSAAMSTGLVKAFSGVNRENQIAVSQAATYQQALAGIETRAKIAGQSFSTLSKQTKELATTFPVGIQGATQMVSVMQRMGAQKNQIAGLAGEFIKLGAATGESATALAASMTSLNRTFGGGQTVSQVAKMNDVLTASSAKWGASAEAISSFSTSIAPMAKQVGMGETAVLGLSTAFARLGEDGGGAATAFKKMLTDLDQAVREGGSGLTVYANAVGMTAEEFKKLAQADAGEAFIQVMEALNAQGPGAVRTLQQMGLDGTRTLSSLTALSQQGNLRQILTDAQKAYGSGVTEKGAEEAFSGVNDQLTKLNETMSQTVAASGQPFLKFLESVLGVSNSLAGSFNKLVSSDFMQVLLTIGGLGGMAIKGTGIVNAAVQAKGFAGQFGRSKAITEWLRDEEKGPGRRRNIAFGTAAAGIGAFATGNPILGIMSTLGGLGLFAGGNTGKWAANTFTAAMEATTQTFRSAQRKVTLPKGMESDSEEAKKYRDLRRGEWDEYDRKVNEVRKRRENKEIGFMDNISQRWGLMMDDFDKEADRPRRKVLKAGGEAAWQGTKAVGSTIGSVLGSTILSGPGLAMLGIGGAGYMGYKMYEKKQEEKASLEEIISTGGRGALDEFRNATGRATEEAYSLADALKAASDAAAGNKTATQNMTEALTLTSEEAMAAGEQGYKAATPDFYMSGSSQEIAARGYALFGGTQNPQDINQFIMDVANKSGPVVAQQVADELGLLLNTGGAQQFSPTAAVSGALNTEPVPGAPPPTTQPQVNGVTPYGTGVTGPTPGYGGTAGATTQRELTEEDRQALVAGVSGSVSHNISDKTRTGGTAAGVEYARGARTDIAKGMSTGTDQDISVYGDVLKAIGYDPVTVGKAQDAAKGKGTPAEKQAAIIAALEQDAFEKYWNSSDLTTMGTEETYMRGAGGKGVMVAAPPPSGPAFAGNPALGGGAPRAGAPVGPQQTSMLGGAVYGVMDKVRATGLTPQEYMDKVNAGEIQISDFEKRQLQGIINPNAQNAAMVGERAAAVMQLGGVSLPTQREATLTAMAGAAPGSYNRQVLEAQYGAQQLMGQYQDQNTSTMTGLTRRIEEAKEAKDLLASGAADNDEQLRATLEGQVMVGVQSEEQLRQFYADRLKAQRNFEIQSERMAEDHARNKQRSQEAYQRSVADAQADYHKSLAREEEDWATQMERQTAAAAKSMMNPYERQFAKQSWSAAGMAGNLQDQINLMKGQAKNLKDAKSKGLSQEAIDLLDLANPANALQLQRMIGDLDPETVKELNRLAGVRTDLAASYLGSESNVEMRYAREDRSKGKRRGAEDFQTQMKRGARDFSIQMKQSEEDFAISTRRMAEDLEESTVEIYGTLDQLQTAYTEGSQTGMTNWKDITVNTVDEATGLYEKHFGEAKTSIEKELGPMAWIVGGEEFKPPDVNDADWKKAGEDVGKLIADGILKGLTGSEYGTAPPGTYGTGQNTGNSGNYGGGGFPHVTGGVGSYSGNWQYYSSGGYHGGADVAAPKGTPIFSHTGGMVTSVKTLATAQSSSGSYGRYVVVSDNERDYYYAHMSGQKAREGQLVTPGTLLGWVGNTGNTRPIGRGYHLHFEVRPRGGGHNQAINPRPWMGEGGIATRRVEPTLGESGFPEVVIPLDARGAGFLEGVMQRYLDTDTARGVRTAPYAASVSTVTNTYDSSTTFSGPIQVQANDPDVMARKLEARTRRSRAIQPIGSR